MREHVHRRRPWSPHGIVAGAFILAASPAVAELPAEVVGSFTRGVQPLVLNRCAAGACHGGAESPAPRFERGRGGTLPEGRATRANLATFLDAVGPERDARTVAALLAAGHPASAARPALRAAPLKTPERVTLERWLAEVRAAERPAADAQGSVVPASAEIEAPPPARPNRFRAMLDAAANPPALPPPAEPPGVIFKNDAPPDE